MQSRRNTIQRQVIHNAVFELKNHPTAEDVYNHIKPEYSSISLGTVYRNLNLLSEDGKLLKVAMTDAADRFDHNIGYHYHLKCCKCGNIADVEVPYIKEIDRDVEDKTGFTIKNHHIIFEGICSHCK